MTQGHRRNYTTLTDVTKRVGAESGSCPFILLAVDSIALGISYDERSAGIGARTRFGSALSRPFNPFRMFREVTGSPTCSLVD